MVPAPRLEEPDDFARFNVIAPADMSDHDIDQALRSARAGHVADGAAYVSIEWLASAAPEPRSAAWQSGLAAMLGYAKGKGWLTPGQEHVQAHIERAEP
jgi:hypothetical protein